MKDYEFLPSHILASEYGVTGGSPIHLLFAPLGARGAVLRTSLEKNLVGSRKTLASVRYRKAARRCRSHPDYVWCPQPCCGLPRTTHN